jgi:hypothetical protein
MKGPLDGLEQGDRIEVLLSDGTRLVGRLQNDPETGPPITSDGEAAGWDEKTLLGGVHVEEDDGTDYQTLLLTEERYGNTWRNLTVRGYRYVEGDELRYEQVRRADV